MIALDHHLGDQRSCVVFAGHHRAIGARAAKGDQIPGGHGRQLTLLGKGITGFTDRSDHIKGPLVHTRGGFADGHDIVPRTIHRRAHQIIHRRVKDQEIAPLALFHIDDGRNKDARIPRNQAAGLDLDLDAQIAHDIADQRAIFGGQRWGDVGAFIGNSKAPAQIETADIMPLAAQQKRQIAHFFIGLAERVQIGQLAADMHVDAHHLDARKGCGQGIDGRGLGDGDAELVFGFAGGDLFMGLGIDIGVDAHRDRRAQA